METNNYKIDFFVAVNGELCVSDKFIVSDGKKLFLLRMVEDLPVLLRRGWLVHIQPLLSIGEETEDPSVYGIELVFRCDLLVEPAERMEKSFNEEEYILDGKKIGKRIEQIRLQHLLPQEVFLFGVDKETVQRWEEGKEIPPIETCMVLSGMAGISLESLLYGKDRLG